MAAETQYTANTGMVVISTANGERDGSGTLGTVLTAASSGTFIKTITVKAQVTTTHGMVRLFAYDGTNTKLIREIEIPATTKSATDPAFEITVPLDFHLVASGILKASTQNAETFNVIAEGQDWTYYTTSVRPESTKYTADQSGMVTISTANANLDGTGILGTVFTASDGNKGALISSVIIKAQVSTTPGMVRLFLLVAGGTARLIAEVKVPAVTKSATAHSFFQRVDFGGRGFALQKSYALQASTEKGESFNVIAEVLEWTYPA